MVIDVMSFSRRWRRRREAERKLEQLVATAEQSAREAREAAHALAQDIEQLRRRDLQADHENQTPARMLRLFTFCMCCLLGAGAAGWRAIPAFAAPNANIAQPGAITALVDPDGDDAPKTPLNPDGDDALNVTIAVNADQSSDQAEYVLYFPVSQAGKKFVLLLRGVAVLDDATFASNVLQASSSFNTSPPSIPAVDLSKPIKQCEPSDSDGSSSLRCQEIHGTVPAGNRSPSGGPCPYINSETFSQISIKGRTSLTIAYDWAHHITSLPEPSNPPKSDQVVAGWGSFQLGRPWVVAALKGCHHLSLNPDWQNFESNPLPSETSHDTFRWTSNDPVRFIVVVSTDRSASWKGNLLLVAAGAGAGLGFGFLPVAYEAGRAWRRLRPKVRI